MLVAAELSTAAVALRAASGQIRGRMDDADMHAQRIATTGFSGLAAEAGLSRFADLAHAFADPAARLEAVAGILEETAAAQMVLDEARRALETMVVPPHLFVFHRAMLASLALSARMLDQACASAVAGACLAGHEADLDRLFFHPFEPLDNISAGHLASAPASVRDAVGATGGLVLEAGPGGYTVMVPPPGADGDWMVAPDSVTTMVAGVSSGTEAKLPSALADAQRVAASTGGPVIVWQGYAPPKDLVAGLDPSSARASADDLAAFQFALQERFPEAQKLVVGHSYGSVVATQAAAEHGLFADNLVLVGSPGVPARNVGELELFSSDPSAPPRVTVADSPTDPIRALRGAMGAVHGYNPASPAFGAERMRGISGGHTSYFSDDAFLEGIGRLARK